MSILKAEELINSAIIHIRVLDENIGKPPYMTSSHDRIQDALAALLDAKEELKDYKL